MPPVAASHAAGGACAAAAAPPPARQKIAGRRAAERRAQARRRLLLAGGSVTVVIALVVALIVVKLGQSPAHSGPPASAGVTAQVQRQVTSVPGLPRLTQSARARRPGSSSVAGQPALTSDGKPELLYIGGEYCPFCAAERWALAAAVSRFGTLSGITLIHSSPSDVYASTPTLSFAKARYTSKYLAFDPVEWFGEATDPSTPFGHVYLEQPNAQQQALFTRYANGSIPFVDIGNRYFLPQVQYTPSDLGGMT